MRERALGRAQVEQDERDRAKPKKGSETTFESSHFYFTVNPIGFEVGSGLVGWSPSIGGGRIIRNPKRHRLLGIGIQGRLSQFSWEDTDADGDYELMESTTRLSFQLRPGGGGRHWMSYAILGFGVGSRISETEHADHYGEYDEAPSAVAILGPEAGAGVSFLGARW